MKKTVLILPILIATLISACDSGPAQPPSDSAIEEELAVMPLPLKEADVETVVAEEFARWSDSSGTLESVIFDDQGNLYFVDVYRGAIIKMTPPSKEFDVVYDSAGTRMFASVDIGPDGRFYITDITDPDHSKIVAMSHDFSEEQEIFSGIPFCDDIIFDTEGNMYISSCTGDYSDPTSSILYAAKDLKEVMPLLTNLSGINGIALNSNCTKLFTSEFTANTLLCSEIKEPGVLNSPWSSCYPYYRFEGKNGPDSIYVDADDNIYQALNGQGRILILDKSGRPILNVLCQNRAGYMDPASVAVKPGTNEAYAVSAGHDGGAIFTFTAPGEGTAGMAVE